MNVFGLTKQELEGKTILDLGAGRDALPAKELEGVAAVVSVSPDYATDTYNVAEGGTERVAALGDELPFKEDVFDMVWMLHVAEHIPSSNYHTKEDRLTDTILEALRVVKEDGVLYIGPSNHVRPDYRLHALANAKGYDFEREEEETPFEVTEWDDSTHKSYKVRILRLRFTKRPLQENVTKN